MNDAEPRDDLKARILKQAELTPAPTRAIETRRAWLLIGGSVLVGLAIFYVRGGIRVTGRPTGLIVGTSLGTAVIAGWSAWMTMGRRRSMLGRSTMALCVVACVTPLALLFWKTVWSAQYPEGLDPWPGRLGFRCLNLSLLLGVVPLLALLFARRGTDPTHPHVAGFSLGASVGLCVALFVDTWCPVAYIPHFLLGHILPIALLALLGFAIGKKVLGPR
jgi:hypothetical protein